MVLNHKSYHGIPPLISEFKFWTTLWSSDFFFLYVHYWISNIQFRNASDTIDSRYIAVVYNTIIHKEQLSQWHNFGQTLYSRTTHHISPSRASYGVSFVRSSRKYDRGISRAHCTYYFIGILSSFFIVSMLQPGVVRIHHYFVPLKLHFLFVVARYSLRPLC